MTVGKLTTALNYPYLVPTFAVNKYRMARDFVRRGDYLKLLDVVYSGAGGRSFYVPYRYWRDRQTTLRTEVFGNTLEFPLSDRGIGYELCVGELREHRATEVFREQLRAIDEAVDAVTVLDIGANIGYYLVQEVELLDSNARVHALEPVPDNRHLLRKNLRHNGIEDAVELSPAAASSERGPVEMDVATESNWARVTDDAGDGTITVEGWPIDEYCAHVGVSTADVNVVRMDVEAYELSVLRGMSDVLAESAPLLVFMELHARRLGNRDTLDAVLDLFEENGFELLATAHQRSEWNLTTIDDLRRAKGAPNVFFYKA